MPRLVFFFAALFYALVAVVPLERARVRLAASEAEVSALRTDVKASTHALASLRKQHEATLAEKTTLVTTIGTLR